MEDQDFLRTIPAAVVNAAQSEAGVFGAMFSHDRNAVRYGVDGNDRICCVDDNWLIFAAANGAPELTPEFVIGKPLWDFFSGREIVDLTRMMLNKVRSTGTGLVIPFRCDGPGVQLPMVLLMQPGEGRSIEIATRSVSEDVHPVLPAPLAKRVGDIVKVCAWCCRIELLTKIWVDVDMALGDLSSLSGGFIPPISHGICPECFDTIAKTVFF